MCSFRSVFWRSEHKKNELHVYAVARHNRSSSKLAAIANAETAHKNICFIEDVSESKMNNWAAVALYAKNTHINYITIAKHLNYLLLIKRMKKRSIHTWEHSLRSEEYATEKKNRARSYKHCVYNFIVTLQSVVWWVHERDALTMNAAATMERFWKKRYILEHLKFLHTLIMNMFAKREIAFGARTHPCS